MVSYNRMPCFVIARCGQPLSSSAFELLFESCEEILIEGREPPDRDRITFGDVGNCIVGRFTNDKLQWSAI
jgi:hypothetical protein